MRYCFYLSLLLLTFGCKRIEPPTDIGLNYFPLKKGLISIYSVDSISYEAFSGVKDSVRYYVKEIITNEKTDSTGYTTFTFEEHYATDTTGTWSYLGQNFYHKNDYHINITKGNYTITGFVFPVLKNRRWNLNVFNSDEPEYASYSSVAKPWYDYSNCAHVFVKEDINIVEESINKSIYALNIGLVYKKLTNIKITDSKKGGYSLITKRIK